MFLQAAIPETLAVDERFGLGAPGSAVSRCAVLSGVLVSLVDSVSGCSLAFW